MSDIRLGEVRKRSFASGSRAEQAGDEERLARLPSVTPASRPPAATSTPAQATAPADSSRSERPKTPAALRVGKHLGSIGTSLVMMVLGHEKKANFIGHWAPTFLILGLYNKMVKLHGSDATAKWKNL